MTDYYVGPVTAELKQWRVTDWMGQMVVLGYIVGDTKKRFVDGAYIHTSAIKKIEKKTDSSIVITRNSVYRLWNCDKDNSNGEDSGSLS